MNPNDRTKASEFAPITAFTCNLAGDNNRAMVVFSSGSGTVAYSSIESISPVNSLPQRLSNVKTAETGNAIYGRIEDRVSTMLMQTFKIQDNILK